MQRRLGLRYPGSRTSTSIHGKESERKRLVRSIKSFGLNFKLPFSHWSSGREVGRVCTPRASTSRLGCSSAGSGGSSCHSMASDGGTGARREWGRAGLPREVLWHSRRWIPCMYGIYYHFHLLVLLDHHGHVLSVKNYGHFFLYDLL